MGDHDKAMPGRYKSEPKGYELEIASAAKGRWLGWLTLPNGRQVPAEGTFNIKNKETWSVTSKNGGELQRNEGGWQFTSLTMEQIPEDPEESWCLKCVDRDYGGHVFIEYAGEEKIRYIVWRGYRAGPEDALPHTPYVFTRIFSHKFPLE